MRRLVVLALAVVLAAIFVLVAMATTNNSAYQSALNSTLLASNISGQFDDRAKVWFRESANREDRQDAAQDAEVVARQAKDADLQAQIDALEGTQPPPPPPPPPPGTVLKRVDFEYPSSNGINPAETFWQCADNVAGARRGTLAKDTSVFHKGLASGHIINPAPSSSERAACEVLWRTVGKTGEHAWYALSFQLPLTWGGHPGFVNGRTSIAHFEYGCLCFVAGFEIAVYDNRAVLALAAGECVNGVGCRYDNDLGGEVSDNSSSTNVPCSPGNGPNPYGGQGGCKVVPPFELTKGVWHEVIVHVLESPRPDGIVEAWWRRQGETWSKTVTMVDTPTLAYGGGGPYTAASYDAGVDLHEKRGLQTFHASPGEHIWLDDLCEATSFEAVEAC